MIYRSLTHLEMSWVPMIMGDLSASITVIRNLGRVYLVVEVLLCEQIDFVIDHSASNKKKNQKKTKVYLYDPMFHVEENSQIICCIWNNNL